MAVSFKVPKSPQRDIFVIDNFMGVDLTNTGSNIDENRSPNAENMVRYVPGKVRKRTGYSVQVEFSKGVNVNRALGTDDEEQVFELEYTGGYDWYQLYDVADGMPINTEIFYEFDYCVEGSANFYVTGSVILNDTGGEWLHASGSTKNTTNYFSKVQASPRNSEDAVLKIKNLSIMRGVNDDYYWKPAPEDDGRKFILTPETSVVYGHHALRTGKKQGDFVTNVNRALGTSSSYQTFADHVLCYLGETIPEGKTVHIGFDYENDTGSTCYIRACANPEPGYYMSGDEITTIQTGTDSVEMDYTAGNNFSLITIESTSVKIKNFIICYATDDDFEWSAAPEDNGAVFDVDNVYQRTGDNTAIFSSKTETQVFPAATRTSVYCPVSIQQSTTAVDDDLTIVDFEVAITVSKNVNNVLTPVGIDGYSVKLVDSASAGSILAYLDHQPNNDHFIFYAKPGSGEYFEKLAFDCALSETTTQLLDVEVSIKNLTVYKCVEKTDFWSSEYINLYHVGKKLYVNKSGKDEYDLIYSNMNQQRSMSWQFEARDNDSSLLGYDNLYIVDGQNLLEYNGALETVDTVYGKGRIPVITNAKHPSGGGNSYYPINRLQPGFEEWFIGDGTTVYQLSFGNLDLSPHVRVWIRDYNDGSWLEQEEGVDYSVNYGLGTVQFTNAPWDATQEGEDNVKIRAFRTVARYVDSINKCSFGTLFGVGGTSDRLFLSGNPDYPNYDFFSADYDPTYFPDTYYATLGVSSSEIKGYARVNNYLATFKDENEPSQSVFIREGDLIVDSNTNVSEPAFKLINTLQGNGAISPYTFGYLQTEPLFLTKSGIYAITAQDITGEKYGQSRSFYLNGKLLKEDNLPNACSVVYNDQYILAINGNLYVLDGLQATRTDRSDPYATRQYVGFYCTGIPANVMWTYNDALWFGTLDGRICQFATDVESLNSYNDDGKAIYCCWETPDLDGKLFYKNKTFRYFAIRMMSAIKTSVKMWSQRLGEWTFIKETTAISKIFDFNDIDFNLFTFRSDSSEKVAHAKVRVKKVDKARFRVENGNLNEPFGLFDLALEYIESGNYKR